jgi:hypothetical protein
MHEKVYFYKKLNYKLLELFFDIPSNGLLHNEKRKKLVKNLWIKFTASLYYLLKTAKEILMKILLTALLLLWHFAIWKGKIKSDSTFINNFNNVNLKSFYKITITKRFGIQKKRKVILAN